MYNPFNSQPENIRFRNHRYITRESPLPDHYFIGQDCINNHGRDGKTTRYKVGKCCIVCNHDNQNKLQRKKYNVRDTTALKHYELLQEKRQLEEAIRDF